ncbi:MAG: 5-(carboxyamino)imidazole ribonucleotide synthase [Alphaproteobacteria bacterium]|nr:5-(carboxyamino)imidazole ribonucleotide synthase [Alphaproteobacteria bacterium]
MKTIGIIGGGQLGRMACLAAHQLGFRSVIFTDQKNSPASFVTDAVIVADYSDQKALKEFCKIVDVVSFEFENIPFETASFVASCVDFHPRAEILKITQNRILEKNFLNEIGVTTTEYVTSNFEENLKEFGKAILKTATMGYDGKGQRILQVSDTLVSDTFSTEMILEKFCPFDSEISVMVARSKAGEIKAYEPLTNIHKNGILDESHYPAKISEGLKIKAQELAKKIAEKLDLVGILAVEMFVIGEEILVNELAPRPHNSGHFSMDACVTSQFEQLIRAITGLPLGSTEFHSKGYMKNLIGDDVKNIEKFFQNPRAKIHLYGKAEAKPGRKMGHVNIFE